MEGNPKDLERPIIWKGGVAEDAWVAADDEAWEDLGEVLRAWEAAKAAGRVVDGKLSEPEAQAEAAVRADGLSPRADARSTLSPNTARDEAEGEAAAATGEEAAKEGEGEGGQEAEGEEEGEELEVESIRAKRVNEDTGGEEFLIRWKGCTFEEDSWEPKANIIDESLITDFEAREARREAALAAQKSKRKKGAKVKGSKFVCF